MGISRARERKGSGATYLDGYGEKLEGRKGRWPKLSTRLETLALTAVNDSRSLFERGRRVLLAWLRFGRQDRSSALRGMSCYQRLPEALRLQRPVAIGSSVFSRMVPLFSRK